MVVDLQLSDPYGTINEGDGTASFFLNTSLLINGMLS